nr:unnamed protein product [Digitaria exilis]
MEGAFDLNTRIFLSLNSKLPYGDKSPRMEFFEAAFKGDLRRLREMASGKDAKAKARLADVCVGGQGPLQAAARMGRLDVVDCMVKELGFDINVGSSETGVTALHAAALDGKLDTVRYLLDNGADPNKKDEPGEVPLHCAAKYGTPLVATLHATSDGLAESIALKCVKLLVEAHADVNSVDPDTPLVVATTHGLTDCIKYPLKAGANPNIPKKCVEKYGRTTKLKLKLDGEKAVERKDYLSASKLYGEEYKGACDAFLAGLKLDPTNADMERMFR